MSDARAAGEPGYQTTALQRAAILATVTFVTMLYAMTVTIANVSLPQMQGSLSATQDQIAWIVTFNIAATAVVTPTAGWLAGRFGRRQPRDGERQENDPGNREKGDSSVAHAADPCKDHAQPKPRRGASGWRIWGRRGPLT